MLKKITFFVCVSTLSAITTFAELNTNTCTYDANILEAQNPIPLAEAVTTVESVEMSSCPSTIMVGSASKKEPAQVYNLFTVYAKSCVYNSIGYSQSANDVIESRVSCDKLNK